MANEVFGYRKLIAYQKGKEVVKRTYHLLKKFPAEERFAMCDQLRRASISVTSNIAEGVKRSSSVRSSELLQTLGELKDSILLYSKHSLLTLHSTL